MVVDVIVGVVLVAIMELKMKYIGEKFRCSWNLREIKIPISLKWRVT